MIWAPFAVAAGMNIVGGAAGLAMANRIRAPKSLQDQIANVQNPNYYAPMLQRLYNSAQGDATIQKNLARQGMLDNAFVAGEQLEANQARAGEAVKEGMQSLEGQRLSMLDRLLGQRAQYDMARQGARMSAVNQMISGFGSAVMAGTQANMQQKQFTQQLGMQQSALNNQNSMWKQFMQTQTGGTMGIVPQLPMGGKPQGTMVPEYTQPPFNPLYPDWDR